MNWVTNFLLSRTQSVLVDGQQSSISNVPSGVPQGRVLGLLLFLAYIINLPNSTARLFTDDSVVYREVSYPDDAARL